MYGKIDFSQKRKTLLIALFYGVFFKEFPIKLFTECCLTRSKGMKKSGIFCASCFLPRAPSISLVDFKLS